jgi:hypothetical protein
VEKLNSHDAVIFCQKFNSPLLASLDAGTEGSTVSQTADYAFGHAGPIPDTLLNRDAFKFGVLEFLALEQAF